MFKVLGVTFDQNLTWKNHIEKLAKKVQVALEFCILSLKDSFQKQYNLSLYQVLLSGAVQAILIKTLNKKKQVSCLQKCTLGEVSNSEYGNHSNPLFIK